MWQRLTVAVATLSVFWTLFLLVFGGVDVTLIGIRIRSHDWRDAATVAAVSLAVLAWQRWHRWGPSAVARIRNRASAVYAWLVEPSNLLLMAILSVAVIARYWAITFGLPHPAARPDEEAVSSMAGGYYDGNFEQTTFTYPPLFMLIVAAAYWVVFQGLPWTLSRMDPGFEPHAPSTAAVRTVQRVLSAAAGVISVWLVFRIALRLFDRATALVAAAFLALCFLHVRDSHFGVTDIPMTFMVLVAFLGIVRLWQSGTVSDLVLAALLTGLAVATKYNAALLVLPASFAIVDDPLRRPVFARLVRVVLFGALTTAAFLVVCPFSIINRDEFMRGVMEVQSHLAQGHGPDLGRGWVHHVTITLRYGLGLPLLAAGIAGMFVMLWREGRRAVLVLLFPIAYYLVSGSGRTVFARHALPLVPFLCLTAGYLVVVSGSAVSRALRRPTWRVALVTVMTVMVLWPSVMSVIAFNRLIAREDSRVTARKWIESRFATGTSILQLGQSNGHPYIYYETNYTLSEHPSADRPALVILVTSPLWSPRLDDVAPWVKSEYDLKYDEHVVAEDEARNVYDRQDEFFAPLAGFHRVDRPGPNVKIYVRRDVAAALK